MEAQNIKRYNRKKMEKVFGEDAGIEKVMVQAAGCLLE